MNSEEDERLHDRIVDGDSTASAELFERHLSWVIDQLSGRARFRALGATRPELIWDAATEAMFAYIADPGSYVPTRSALRSFLVMSAQGDLLNAIAKERRASQRYESLDHNVELHEFAGNIPSEEDRADHRVQEAELWSRIIAVVPDEADQAVVRLMLDGERSRDEYARVLNITDLPDHERKRKVDRAKDRLKKRLQRAGRARMGDL